MFRKKDPEKRSEIQLIPEPVLLTYSETLLLLIIRRSQEFFYSVKIWQSILYYSASVCRAIM
jgi:hypothetical protein